MKFGDALRQVLMEADADVERVEDTIRAFTQQFGPAVLAMEVPESELVRYRRMFQLATVITSGPGGQERCEIIKKTVEESFKRRNRQN